MPTIDKAFFFVRDQTFDHQQEAVSYYLDQEVRFDIKVYYLGRSFNEVIQKMAKLVNSTIDASASPELFFEQKSKLVIHSKMIKLDQRNKTLTRRIHKARFRNIANAQSTTLFQKKKKAETRLNASKKRLRVKMIAQT